MHLFKLVPCPDIRPGAQPWISSPWNSVCFRAGPSKPLAMETTSSAFWLGNFWMSRVHLPGLWVYIVIGCEAYSKKTSPGEQDWGAHGLAVEEEHTERGGGPTYSHSSSTLNKGTVARWTLWGSVNFQEKSIFNHLIKSLDSYLILCWKHHGHNIERSVDPLNVKIKSVVFESVVPISWICLIFSPFGLRMTLKNVTHEKDRWGEREGETGKEWVRKQLKEVLKTKDKHPRKEKTNWQREGINYRIWRMNP